MTLHSFFGHVRLPLASGNEDQVPLLQELWAYFVTRWLTPDYSGYIYENIKIDPNPLISPAAVILAAFAAVMIGCSLWIFRRRTLGRLVRRLLRQDALGPQNAKTFAELSLDAKSAPARFINRLTLAKMVRCVEEDAFYGVNTENSDSTDSPEGEEGAEKAESAESAEPAGNEPDASTAETADTPEGTPTAETAEKTEETEKTEEIRPDAFALSQVAKVKYKRKPEDHFYIAADKKHRAAVLFDSKGTNPMGLLVVAASFLIVAVLLVKIWPSLLHLFDKAISGFKRF